MNFIIAGAFSKHVKLAIFFMKNKTLSKHKITVYDGINNCAWNGGRINRDIYWSQNQINYYYNRGIDIALTFTNPIIDLTDTVGNELLEKFHKRGNRIILVNDHLRRYIRNNYPLYKITYSITGMGSLGVPMTDFEVTFYRELESKYDLIVPKMEHIFDDRFKQLNQGKYEIMLNDTCAYKCPLYREHFEAIAEQNRLTEKPWEEIGHDICHKVEECWLPNFNPDLEDHGIEGMDLTKDQIKILKSRGINYFKISGRELELDEFVNELETYLEDT